MFEGLFYEKFFVLCFNLFEYLIIFSFDESYSIFTQAIFVSILILILTLTFFSFI